MIDIDVSEDRKRDLEMKEIDSTNQNLNDTKSSDISIDFKVQNQQRKTMEFQNIQPKNKTKLLPTNELNISAKV